MHRSVIDLEFMTLFDQSDKWLLIYNYILYTIYYILYSIGLEPVTDLCSDFTLDWLFHRQTTGEKNNHQAKLYMKKSVALNADKFYWMSGKQSVLKESHSNALSIW